MEKRIDRLRRECDAAWKTYETLVSREGTPNELLDEAQDAWTAAAHALYEEEGLE